MLLICIGGGLGSVFRHGLERVLENGRIVERQKEREGKEEVLPVATTHQRRSGMQ